MSEKRKRLSGHTYRTIAKEKEKRFKEQLANTPKLETFFGPAQSTANQEKSIDLKETYDIDKFESDDCTAGQSSESEIKEVSLKKGEISDDPADWQINNELIDYIALHGIPQNTEVDFTPSARKYNDQTRYMSKSFFSRKLKNGEVTHRFWLTYSKIGVVFCTPCRLFGGSCKLSSSSGW